jgi:biopolymer transport protein ExbD
MRFFVRKRRTTPTVIIVALIDVLIVLLIFLMVTTTFRQQTALKLALPESSEAKKAGANENPPFVVSVDPNGVYFLEKQPVTLEQLQGRLRDAVAKNPQLVLAINADEKAPWGKIVKVRDVAAVAKIKSLVAYTKEKTTP